MINNSESWPQEMQTGLDLDFPGPRAAINIFGPLHEGNYPYSLS